MMLRKRTSLGFSLLELLLAIGLFAAVMLAVLTLMRSYAEREIARSTSRYMMSVMEAMREVLSNPNNFDALYAQAAAGGNGGAQFMADATDASPANIMKDMPNVGGVYIQKTSKLNENFSYRSPLRSEVRILLRVANAGGTNALEMLVVMREPKSDSIVQKAATEGGFHGGWIRTYNGIANARMVSAFKSWQVNPNIGLQATNWYTDDLRNLHANLNSSTEGSFLVYYDYLNRADIASDYLYRTLQTRDLNTMYGPLDMGSHSIGGADDVYIAGATFAASGNPKIAGTINGTDIADSNLYVEEEAAIRGSATVSRTMTVQGSALVAESMNARALQIQNSVPESQRVRYGAQNLLVVDSALGGSTDDQVKIRGYSTFTNGAVADVGHLKTVNAADMSIPDRGGGSSGGYLEVNSIADAEKISANTVEVNSIHAQGSFITGEVNDASIIVKDGPTNTGRMGVDTIKNLRNLTYGPADGSNSKTLDGTNLILRADKLSLDSFGNCNNCTP